MPQVDPQHFGLETICDAYRAIKARTARGKVIIEIATDEHGESMFDESIEETFPASDPIAPATAR